MSLALKVYMYTVTGDTTGIIAGVCMPDMKKWSVCMR